MTAEVSADTIRCWETYASAHFIPFFETGEELCSDARLGDYMRHRLTQVKRTTLKKELSALNRLFDWMVEQGLLGSKPTIPRIPKRATGTPHPKGKRETVTLTSEEMDAIVAQLPERSKLGHPMRAYYEVMRETGLRPSTLQRLKAPDDYQAGAAYLTIREEADKARYGRELPLSDRARAALDSACPERGVIFSKFDGRHTLRKAALAAGLDPERASKFSAYDLRHSLATELTERSGNPATSLASATYSATSTSQPPTTTSTPAVEPPNRSYRDTDWDTSRSTASPPRLVVLRNYPESKGAEERTRTSTSCQFRHFRRNTGAGN